MEFEIRVRRHRDLPYNDDAIGQHLHGLSDLDEQGRLIAAGRFEDGTGRLVLARCDSLADAQAYAERDASIADRRSNPVGSRSTRRSRRLQLDLQSNLSARSANHGS